MNAPEPFGPPEYAVGYDAPPGGAGLHQQVAVDLERLGPVSRADDAAPELDAEAEGRDADAAEVDVAAADRQAAAGERRPLHLDVDAQVGEDLEQRRAPGGLADDEVGVEHPERPAAVEFADEMHRAVGPAKDPEPGVDLGLVRLVEPLPHAEGRQPRPELRGDRVQPERRLHIQGGGVRVKADHERMDLPDALPEDMGQQRP